MGRHSFASERRMSCFSLYLCDRMRWKQSREGGEMVNGLCFFHVKPGWHKRGMGFCARWVYSIFWDLSTYPTKSKLLVYFACTTTSNLCFSSIYWIMFLLCINRWGTFKWNFFLYSIFFPLMIDPFVATGTQSSILRNLIWTLFLLFQCQGCNYQLFWLSMWVLPRLSVCRTRCSRVCPSKGPHTDSWWSAACMVCMLRASLCTSVFSKSEQHSSRTPLKESNMVLIRRPFRKVWLATSRIWMSTSVELNKQQGCLVWRRGHNRVKSVAGYILHALVLYKWGEPGSLMEVLLPQITLTHNIKECYL